MGSQYWSWVLAAIGITGLYIAGRRNWIGWAIGFGVQWVWLAYALATRQWGFVASAIAYGVVYAKNLISWRRAEAEEGGEDG